MKKLIIIALTTVLSVFSALGYFFTWQNRSLSTEVIIQEQLVQLPKSEYFKVTSTAKGHDQRKLARHGDQVFTFYLDNSPTNGIDNEDSSNKNMVLIQIKADGSYVEFDSIPVWMHGNVLVNPQNGKIYYTTYEIDNTSFKKASIHLYTYQLVNDVPTRMEARLIEEDTSYYSEDANPRVGADIDSEGNIAITYGTYSGTMKTHVYDAAHDIWIQHVVQHVTPGVDDGDCNLYPFVRINGINDIRIIANQDSNINGELLRMYERYFYYNGVTWIHRIISDVRENQENIANGFSVRDTDLFVDEEGNSHIILCENKGITSSKFREIIITPEGIESEKDITHFSLPFMRNFIKIVQMGEKKYYVSSGMTLDLLKFKLIGYLEVYDYDSMKLVYRLKGVSKEPYLYIAKPNENEYFDIMIVSRDKNYQDDSETFYIRLKQA